jgi:ubiquitin carboxyl-terminal hydrolase 22/27/51
VLPYGPVTFLATTWKASAELSGYAQQDAHEFFISTLNLIHSTSRGSTNVSCNCIIHSTFAGSLQSDVKCERCHNVTSTIDPILDISLELKGKGGDIATAENTLGACLRRFD